MDRSKALCKVLQAYQLKYPKSVSKEGTEEHEVFETVIEMIGREKMKENTTKKRGI